MHTAAVGQGGQLGRRIIGLVLVLAVLAGAGSGLWVLHWDHLAQQAADTAATYCAALHQDNAARAYQLLAPDAQRQTSMQTFSDMAQLHDQIDGSISACSVSQPTWSAGLTLEPPSSSALVPVRMTRHHSLRGALALTQIGGQWRIANTAASFLGTNLGPLLVEQQFCASLVAQQYAQAAQDMTPAFRTQVPVTALATLAGNTTATTLTSCDATPSTYTLAAAGAQGTAPRSTAQVLATFAVKTLGNAQPHTLHVPELVTFTHGSAWQIANLALDPPGLAPALTAAPIVASQAPSGAPASPPIQAAAAMLLDPTTNTVYLARNSDQQRAMASTTKIMAAVVALTLAPLTQPITVGADATALENGIASVAGLRQGDVLTLHDLLYALLLPSGDDAAVVLADGIAGSQSAYVALMNMEAQLLGLHETHYSDVHGLDAPHHYTSAHDLALLTEFALRSRAFAQIVATPTWQVPAATTHQAYTWTTTNLLLTTEAYPGITGVKTGYTGNAGACLVFAATRGTHHLLGTVLGEPDEQTRFTDAAALLTWGFGLES